MWRARPIFISSTFQDMQAERDYLRTRVFPELEERLRARRHHLEWVDLRVGVATASEADEARRELQVLRVCLAEVKRCRPFFIVLLGDRYGWVPPPERMRAVAVEEGFSADLTGRSVTDLEIEFGILADQRQQHRSFFYFREPLPYDSMPPEVAAMYSDAWCREESDPEERSGSLTQRFRGLFSRNEKRPDAMPRGGGGGGAAGRLADLKRRIETALPDRVRHYRVEWETERRRVTGLEAWGRQGPRGHLG